MAAPHSSSDILTRKQAARSHALAIRAGCDPALGALLGRHLLAERPPPGGAVVAGFWPMPQEIDIRPLLTALHQAGHPVVLPVTPKRGLPLKFRRWRPERPMIREAFGTLCPDGEEMRPDLLLVPLLAFDRRGHRLGYGAGYYDRTLAALPGAVTIGCAYAALELDEVPASEYDVPLAAVATEHGVIDCKGP